MAGDNRNSIPYDRSAIGASDDLDEYGIWVKSGPQELSVVGSKMPEFEPFSDGDIGESINIDDLEIDEDFSLIEKDIFDLEGLDEEEGPVKQAVSGEDEPADLPPLGLDEAEEPDGSLQGLPPLDLDEADRNDEALMGFSSGLSQASAGMPPLILEDEPAVEDALPPEADFSEDSLVLDDFSLPGIDSPEAEIPEAGEIPEAPLPAPAPSPGHAPGGENAAPVEEDLSTKILGKIADELALIKHELAGLKEEIAIRNEMLKGEPPESKTRGFFDGKEDERVALTGDELDSILDSPDAAPSDTPEERDELEQLMEEGVQPMTMPPLDTAYLDGDVPFVADDVFGHEADIGESEGFLGEITDIPVTEPAPEDLEIDEQFPAGDTGGETLSPEEYSPEIDDFSSAYLDDGGDELKTDFPEREEELDLSTDEAFLDETPSPKPASMPDTTLVKNVLSYLDRLLESLPEEKIEEFAKSSYFDSYKKLFRELGLY
jgi:hypothetical protein